MSIKQSLARVIERRDLSHAEMNQVMHTIMGGEATPAQIGALLAALRMKGETVEEITAAVEVMRELATRVPVPAELYPRLVDIVGTGGDGANLFNVSTAAAFVAAAAGARVAKHGNRSASSRSGSADLLEACGVTINLGPDAVLRCIEQAGLGFMFAPLYHGAMRHAVGPRRDMGTRTLFNLIGPLTNPALAPNQVLGVFDAFWLEPVAQVLQRLQSRHVMVVHSDDGLDEISIAAPTQVAELRDGRIQRWVIEPEAFDLSRSPLDSLRVADAGQSLALIRAAFAGERGPAADTIALNAGAGLYVGGVAETMEQGVRAAQAAMEDGSAHEGVQRLVSLSRESAG